MILDYDDWCEQLNEDEIEEIEDTGGDYHEAYAHYYSDAQCHEYDEFRDGQLDLEH